MAEVHRKVQRTDLVDGWGGTGFLSHSHSHSPLDKMQHERGMTLDEIYGEKDHSNADFTYIQARNDTCMCWHVDRDSNANFTYIQAWNDTHMCRHVGRGMTQQRKQDI